MAAAGATLLAGCAANGDETPTDSGTPTTTPRPASTDSAEQQATPSSTAAGPRRVEFRSTTDTALTGTLYGGGDVGVVLVPQINLDRESWEPQATELANQGHLALAIDEDPDDRAASALGAARYLRETVGVSRVVLVGASSGGEAVVRANARAATSGEHDPVDGTVALSPGGGAEVADRLGGRKLFVVSEGDEDRFVRVTRDLHAGAPDPKTLATYDGSAHGQAIFETSHGTELRSRLFGLVESVAQQ